MASSRWTECPIRDVRQSTAINDASLRLAIARKALKVASTIRRFAKFVRRKDNDVSLLSL
jgi:hypothetical protein